MLRAVKAGRSVPAWPKDVLRVSFGIIWLIDAVLKWLPGFRSGYMDMLMGQAQDQPGWLKPWFDFWINVQHPGRSSSPTSWQPLRHSSPSR